MSLRYEQYRSLRDTRRLLSKIRGDARYREEADHCLRHFPVLAKNGEPLFSNDDFPCPDLEEKGRI